MNSQGYCLWVHKKKKQPSNFFQFIYISNAQPYITQRQWVSKKNIPCVYIGEFIFPSDGPQPNWNCSRIINHSHTSHITYTQRMRTREPYAWHTEYSYQFTKTLCTTFPRGSARYKLLWQSSVTFIQHQDQDQHQDLHTSPMGRKKNPKKGKKMRKELKNNNTAGDIFYDQYSQLPSLSRKLSSFAFLGYFYGFLLWRLEPEWNVPKKWRSLLLYSFLLFCSGIH